MLGSLRAIIPPAGPSPSLRVGQVGCGSPQGFPSAVVQRPGSAVCRKRGTSTACRPCVQRKSCKELVGPGCLGNRALLLPRTAAAFPRRLLSHCQAAVFSPDLIFYYTSREGLQGHLREPWRSHGLAQGLFGGGGAPAARRRFWGGCVRVIPRLFLFLLPEPPQTGGSLVTVTLCL